MSRLLRLYPRAFRARYEVELRAVLEDRPPGRTEMLDLVLGAFRAHVDRHPRHRQLSTDGSGPVPPRRLHPAALGLIGLAGLGSAYALSVGVISVANPDPDRWAGWGPVGFTLAAAFVLAGLVLGLRRPALGGSLGLVGTVLCVAAAPWLFFVAIPIGLTTAVPFMAARMRPPGPSRPAEE
jgi:hypothetical protein